MLDEESVMFIFEQGMSVSTNINARSVLTFLYA